MVLIDDIGLRITWISPMPVKVNGNFCDVFEGMHVEVGKVALKRPRIGSAGYDDMVVRVSILPMRLSQPYTADSWVLFL